MTSWVVIVVLVGVSVGGVASQQFFIGPCPAQAPVTTFVSGRYLGHWYEQQKYFAIFQFAGSCTTADYSLRSDGLIGVLNTQTSLIGTQSTIEGSARFQGAVTEAKLLVTFPSVGNNAADYWVLDTDYVGYSVVWSCKNYVLFNYQFMWVLTRDRNPTTTFLNDIRSKIAARGLATWPLYQTRQNCAN